MFWQNCIFEPTPAFRTVKHLFDVKLETDDDLPLWEAAQDEIASLGLKLIIHETNLEISEFILHIDNKTTTLRYVDPGLI